jgi:hypothetical protein
VAEGAEFDDGMHHWLDAFAALACQEIGFGWIVLRAPGPAGGHPWVLVEDLAHSERLPDGAEVAAFVAGCARLEELTVPQLLATPARLASGATVETTAHLLGAGQVLQPPRLGMAGSVGPGGWRPGVPVPPVLLAALLAEGRSAIGERLDEAAQAEGVDPLDILAPALTGLRELIRMGIVRTD